jgi:hypothetical protein
MEYVTTPVKTLPIYDRAVEIDKRASKFAEFKKWGSRGYRVVGITVADHKDDCEWFLFLLKKVPLRERLKNWRNGFGITNHGEIPCLRFNYMGFPSYDELEPALVKVLNKLKGQVVDGETLGFALAQEIE